MSKTMADKKVERRRKGNSFKVRLAVGCMCVLMTLFLIMSLITLVLIINLKADIGTIQSRQNVMTESTDDEQDHIHPPHIHQHPLQTHTHPPLSHTSTDFVAFSMARKTSFGPVTNESRVPMGEVLYNAAVVFQHDNKFHAPRKGVYAFTFVSAVESGLADVYLYKQKVGGKKEAVARAVCENHCSVSSSVMLLLDKDETVSVWLRPGTTTQVANSTDVPASLFSGILRHSIN